MAFQSRNGLIWTLLDYNYLERVEGFQSRNGLIWTQYFDTLYNETTSISIPQRSDLNLKDAFKRGNHCLFQSRNGLIWTEYHEMLKAQYLEISIPQRSDLNENKPPHIPIEVSDFNPATVWFERRRGSGMKLPML